MRRRNPVLTDVRTLTRGKRDRYLYPVWSMLVSSYKDIGVPHQHPDELLADYAVWEVGFDADKVPRSFNLSKRTPRGLKSAASGSDGTLDGRDTIKHSIATRFFKPGVYGEVSEKVERIAARAGAPAVCASEAGRVIGKFVSPSDDGLHYRRMITGVGEHTKVLMGRPKGTPTTSYAEPHCPVPNPKRKRRKRRAR